MSMHKKNGVQVCDLAVLASSVGLVENSDDGRQAFCAWWANDNKAARKALSPGWTLGASLRRSPAP